VVDAESGQPLPDVAVLAVWHRHVAGHPPIPVGIGEAGYFASEEAVTGADGWFTVPARVLFNPSLALRVVGPELTLFRGGYGGWRFAGPAEALAGAGVRIEMRPLRTADERARYLDGRWTAAERAARARGFQHGDRPGNPGDVPYQRAARYEAAVNAERTALGLKPIGIGYPGLWTESAVPRQGPDRPALKGASGVAVDATGHVYVADTEHHRVVKLGPTLEVVTAWGSFGRADGEFQLPHGVAVDGSGRVYVADWGNRRIQTFTADGRFVDKWGELRANELGGLFTPTHVAVTDLGEIVVHAGRVHRFTASGRRLGQWGESPRLGSRGGIAVDGAGHVYGVTGDPRPGQPPLRRWDAAGVEIAAWGVRGSAAGQVFDPIAFAVDRRGRVYVADWGGPRVLVFDARGSLVHQWDARAAGGPALRYPAGLAVDPRGRVYVVDRASPRVHVLGPLPGAE
jgi:hypothetical protein